MFGWVINKTCSWSISEMVCDLEQAWGSQEVQHFCLVEVIYCIFIQFTSSSDFHSLTLVHLQEQSAVFSVTIFYCKIVNSSHVLFSFYQKHLLQIFAKKSALTMALFCIGGISLTWGQWGSIHSTRTLTLRRLNGLLLCLISSFSPVWQLCDIEKD